MATVVNNPASSDSGSSMGMIVGILVVLALIVLFLLFVMPGLRGTTAPAEVQAPAGNGGTNVQIPDEVDVNLNQQP